MDKWADYKKRNCSCLDASIKNSCKGLPNCSLRPDHPKRQLEKYEFLRFWNGRPKDGHWTPFDYNYKPVDWRGML